MRLLEIRHLPDVVPIVRAEAGTRHRPPSTSHIVLTQCPKTPLEMALRNAPASQVWPQMGKILTQPSAAGLPLPPAVWPSLLPVQPLTYGRVRGCPPAGVLVPSCAQTLLVWFGEGLRILPVSGSAGRKEGGLSPSSVSGVQAIKNGLPHTKKWVIFPGADGGVDGTREHLTKSCWRFHDNLSGELGPQELQYAGCPALRRQGQRLPSKGISKKFSCSQLIAIPSSKKAP